MAVTGDGKSLETAYVVHDYWELKAVCSTNEYPNHSSSVKYVKLANDIDCNADAYPNDFEWEGIKLYYETVVVDLNLNNKSIKNVMIANDSFLFRGHYNSQSCSKIHDGKILNIFCNTAHNIIDSSAESDYIYCKLENLSMSLNGTSLSSYAFYRCAIDGCAIYYVSAKLNQHIFRASSCDSQYLNTDFYFDVADTNNVFAYIDTYNCGNPVWNGCRFGGKLGGIIPNDLLYNANNVVVDVELTYSGGNYFIRYSTGIINSSKATNSTGKLCTLTWVNSTEIKSASELMKKGFVVTDIRPATSTT